MDGKLYVDRNDFLRTITWKDDDDDDDDDDDESNMLKFTLSGECLRCSSLRISTAINR